MDNNRRPRGHLHTLPRRAHAREGEGGTIVNVNGFYHHRIPRLLELSHPSALVIALLLCLSLSYHPRTYLDCGLW